MEIQHITTQSEGVSSDVLDELNDFLFEHLDEFGDKKEDIRKAMDYALNPQRGGDLVIGRVGPQIVGAIVINNTGMEGYIPSHILVYIAVHNGYRGQGIGKKLMQFILPNLKGGVALHVEPHNPARFLYEKLGFSSKYLEMRRV